MVTRRRSVRVLNCAPVFCPCIPSTPRSDRAFLPSKLPRTLYCSALEQYRHCLLERRVLCWQDLQFRTSQPTIALCTKSSPYCYYFPSSVISFFSLTAWYSHVSCEKRLVKGGDFSRFPNAVKYSDSCISLFRDS